VGNHGSVAGSSHGRGGRLLVCFHGYGQTRNLFLPLLSILPEDMRMVTLDLPFFGESTWVDGGRPVLNTDWDHFLHQLLEMYPSREVHFLAFSMGAKIALGLYQTTAILIHSVTLISPDGLRIHPLYRFSLYHPVGRALFYTVFRLPRLFLFILRMLYKLRITDPFKYRFVSRQIDTPEKRALLRRVWRGHAKIRPDIQAIAQRSSASGTKWHIIWGEEDTILPLELCKDFIETVKDAKLHVVDGGHFLLTPLHESVKSLLKAIFER
jgi:pimeloyl-ACP methyl ester carboxylesterase